MQKEKHANYHGRYNSFYQSKAWRKIRTAFFAAKNGLCEHCAKKGVVRPGKEVHHIVPIEKNWERRFDWENLELLCYECHQGKEHGRESALQKFNDFWEGLNAEKTESRSN